MAGALAVAVVPDLVVAVAGQRGVGAEGMKTYMWFIQERGRLQAQPPPRLASAQGPDLWRDTGGRQAGTHTPQTRG